MPRVIVAALAIMLLLLTAASAWAQAAQSGSYTPPPRGAPEGRVGGASRDISAERRVALVIGNGAYQHLPRLNNPANDAQLMAATLKSLGFDLVEGHALTDIDRAGFERVIREFGAKLGSGGVGLFYYAGHGVQVQGANYLVPVGANPTGTGDVDFELVNADLVLKQMEAAGSRLNFVILDACRNNPLGGGGLRSLGSGLAQMRAPTGTLVSYATQPGNVALDGANGHSPYTLALVDAMRRPGLGVFEVFNTAAVTVKNTTGGEQQPWVSNSPIEGNFYFFGPTTVTVTPTPVAPPQSDAEVVFWQSIANSTNPADFDEYLRRYPNGRFTGLARNRTASLRPPATSGPTLAPQANGSAPFDGIWSGNWQCPASGSYPAFSYGLIVQVKDNSVTRLNTTTDTPGTAGFDTWNGTIKPDGTIYITRSGISSGVSGAYDRGRKYYITIDGRFSGDLFQGKQTPGRGCIMNLSRRR
jgi:hypothetical protein